MKWFVFVLAGLLVIAATPAFAQKAVVGGVSPSVRPGPPPPAFAPVIDSEAMALLAKAQAKLQKIHSLSAQLDWTLYYPSTPKHPHSIQATSVYSLRLMRPNFALIDSWTQRQTKDGAWQKDPDNFQTWASDGKTNWLAFNSYARYVTTAEESTGKDIRLGLVEPLKGFFDPDQSLVRRVKLSQKKGRLISLICLGSQIWEGSSYQVVEWKHVSDDDPTALAGPNLPADMIDTDDLYIGADGLVHRITTQYNIAWSKDYALRNVQVDSPMTKASFAYKPPPGYHLPDRLQHLLAKGTHAPDFTVQGATGSPIALSDYRGKVVVIDFWATWCNPCQLSLEHTNEFEMAHPDKDVVVLAVNVADTQENFDNWLPSHQGDKALVFAIDTKYVGTYVQSLYNVVSLPVQYVIDKTGKVAASFQGYNASEQPLENAIKALLASS